MTIVRKTPETGDEITCNFCESKATHFYVVESSNDSGEDFIDCHASCDDENCINDVPNFGSGQGECSYEERIAWSVMKS